MSQSKLGNDEELFGEAATEMRDDVEASIAEARAALPDADAIWETDADNVLGVLNGLRSALDIGDAEEHIRDAKKWYTMGERANAFDDAEDLETELEELEELVETIEAAHEQVGDLTSTLPELKGSLEEAAESDSETEDEEEEE